MGNKILHETAIQDIISLMRDGVERTDRMISSGSRKNSISKYSSITKAASDLTLVTPVLCSTAISKESAMMITKAIERKNVALYQMLFSAYSITHAEDAISHLQQFHTNLDIDKMNLDKFIDTMDNLQESAEYSYISPATVKAIHEQYLSRSNEYAESDIDESSISKFREINTYSGTTVIAVNEDADDRAQKERHHNADYRQKEDFETRELTSSRLDREQRERAHDADLLQKDQFHADDMNQKELERRQKETFHTDDRTDRDLDRQQKKRFHDDDLKQKDLDRAYRTQRDSELDQQNLDRMRQSASQSRQQQIQYQLLPSDVKKANELQPSLMIVNFYCNDKDKDLNIAQQFVCGVKAKLYPVDPEVVMTKIITKNKNNDVLLSLIKVTTGEISFVKDFLFAIDDAKIDTIAKSKKKSGAAAFRALEKRALKSKLRKGLRSNNMYKNVAALVISQEEVEELQKYSNVNVMDPKVIVPIMDELALLYFIVVDELSESISFLESGSYEYETYTFSALEKEATDSNYKKVVNLLTKVSR